MEIAILADIHGNFEAFKTAVKYCEKRNIKEYIFLGDYLGEFANVEETMKLLYEMKEKYKCTYIRGNKEEYWIQTLKWRKDKWKEGSSTTGCMLYVYERLSKKDIDFFASMDISKKLTYEGMEDITVCHGSPFGNNESLKPDDEKTREIIDKCDTNVIFCGHTHIQREMDYGEKKIYNPGAIGVPTYSGGNKTQFAILKAVGEKWQVEFKQLKYDVERVVAEQLKAGLDKKAPYWWKITNHLLHDGMYPNGHTMRKVMELCKGKTGKCDWPDIPEEIWKETYEEIFGAEEIMSRDVFEDKKEKDYPVCLESKLIHESKWMSLYCDKVQMPKGNIIDTYYKVHIPNESVAVVVVNEEDKILLIESKRYTTKRLEWEIPAGAIEAGECPESAARRECFEETGYQISSLEYMGCNNPCNGLNDLLIHYYVARVKGEAIDYDSNEVGRKQWVSKEDIKKFIKNNETKSGISAYGLLMAVSFYLI